MWMIYREGILWFDRKFFLKKTETFTILAVILNFKIIFLKYKNSVPFSLVQNIYLVFT